MRLRRPASVSSNRPSLYLIIALLFALLTPALAGAQFGAPTAEAPAAAEEPQEPELPPDPLNRHTPQSLVVGLLETLAEQDYARAARYLDLRAIPASRRQALGPELAQQLQSILDRAGSVDSPRKLSNAPEGRLDDDLEPDQDHFAQVRTAEGAVDLILERREHPEYGPIWRISGETVEQIPQLAAEVDVGLLGRLLPEQLTGGPRLAGVPLGHWLALLVLAALAYLAAWVIVAVLAYIVRRLWRTDRNPHAQRLVDTSVLPVRVFFTVWIFSTVAVALGTSIVARQYFNLLAEIATWVALAWLALRIVDALGAVAMDRMSDRGHLSAFSAIRFFRRGGKIALIVLAGIAILDSFGFDVTAGLAALGIGGLALALGAQKTVENFVGSLTLIADRTVRVGDFCKFGDKIGTVEDIGMRSTRIRTLDRTVIIVPNGEFSSLQIENYAHRDQFWFHPALALRYETTPDQIRYLLVEIRAMLYAHPKVDPEPARVRFTGFGADSLNLDVFAYLNAESYDDFLEIQEDLMLRIMDIVAESGTGFAFPSQTVYMARDPGLSEEKTRDAEAKVRDWRAHDELQIPSFEEGRIETLRGSAAYPPEGSAMRKGAK